jgi:hypothetical protein
MGKLAKIWAVLAIILPTVVALILIFRPMSFITPGTRIAELAMTIGFRNLAVSIILAVAFFTQTGRIVGFLLLVRGLTDVADATATYLSTGNITTQILLPLVLASASFLAAYFLITTDPKTEKSELSSLHLEKTHRKEKV